MWDLSPVRWNDAESAIAVVILCYSESAIGAATIHFQEWADGIVTMRDILRQTGVSDTAQRGVWQIVCHYVNVFFFHITLSRFISMLLLQRVRAKHTGLCVFVVLSELHVWIWGWCMAQPCLLRGCHPHLLFSRKMSFTISVTGTVFLPEMSPLGNSFVFIWLDVRGICLPDAAYMIDTAIYPNTGREASQTQTHTSLHFNACAHTHTHTHI